MKKLIANIDFDMSKEELHIVKGMEILVDEVEETTFNEDGAIVINEERAEQLEKATFNGQPFVMVEEIIEEEVEEVTDPIEDEPQEDTQEEVEEKKDKKKSKYKDIEE